MIYLVGRSDSQIKSRGYRIELGEIEAAMHATPGVQSAAVVAPDAAGTDDKVICCAYVQLPGYDLPPPALKQQLAKVLPRYMIPARWMTLERMPLNASGKTDRALLKEQFVTTEGGEEGVIPGERLLAPQEAEAAAVAKSG